MSVQSLEQERQEILQRMQARREDYRRMLTDGGSLDGMPMASHIDTGGMGMHYAPVDSPAADIFPRSMVMRTLTEHPLWVAAGVAAIIAIGPKRIARTALTGGTAVAAMSARHRSSTDLVARLLSMGGAYLQGKT